MTTATTMSPLEIERRHREAKERSMAFWRMMMPSFSARHTMCPVAWRVEPDGALAKIESPEEATLRAEYAALHDAYVLGTT